MSEYICDTTSMDDGSWDTVISEEIIRCRDCIQFDARTGICAYHSPSGYDFMPESDGFCFKAERREA